MSRGRCRSCLHSQGAVLPASTAASVSLCSVWRLSVPVISKLRLACRPSHWMRSWVSGLYAPALPCVAALRPALPRNFSARRLAAL